MTAFSSLAADADQDIATLQDLADHLKIAAHVELSTIPLYLYATYSIKTRGYSQWAAGASAQRLMTGIAIEEMLHLTNVRNLLVAIGKGSQLRCYNEEFIPQYPKPMEGRVPELMLHLRRLSTGQIDTFRGVEEPEGIRPPRPEAVRDYLSLGEFYRRIEKGIRFLSSEEAKDQRIDWDQARETLWRYQYHRGYWNQNGGSDGPRLIVSEDTALQAMEVIVDQGEGAWDDHGYLPDPIVRDPANAYPPPEIGKQQASHYTKFTDIKKGLNGIGVVKDDNGVQKFTIDSKEVIWPVLDDPKIDLLKDTSPVRDLMVLSNAVYSYVLALLDGIYEEPMAVAGSTDNDPFTKDTRYGLERAFIAVMQGVLYPVADLLVRTPLTADDLKVPPQETVHAGPPFQYYRFTKEPQVELMEKCTTLLAHFPELGGDDGVLRQIGLLPALPHLC
ncbi:ferritin-like protein [Streptomyces roseoverticillatus]|uniref:ferritin-like domain-containing protein n=1 Tax=Streptomyces roseoverticillatus TaxID=66429 RepID=UPI001F350809|nr:ferritin-like protein [Streptomyces roseoverticillatus]MCF3101278.1 ferritin-like protein [Streptomyces roseoverticillatus]